MKLVLRGQMHVLRWRRGWFIDEVLFDDRRIATSRGLFGRESIFGLNLSADQQGEDESAQTRLLFTIDPEESWSDWTGEGRPRGVRLESADEVHLAFGSLGISYAEPFRDLYDRAVKALGLSS